MFHWVLYLFGGFLVLTGVKMALQRHGEIHPEQNPVVRLFTRFMPVTAAYHAGTILRAAGRTVVCDAAVSSCS